MHFGDFGHKHKHIHKYVSLYIIYTYNIINIDYQIKGACNIDRYHKKIQPNTMIYHQYG